MKKLITIAATVVLLLTMVISAPVAAKSTKIHVNPGDSIQDAIDGASRGDTIILDGIFSNYATVTVGTSGITIKSASPGSGILDGGVGPAFRLVDGLSDATIDGLVIRNRTGSRGGGIEAWNSGTRGITVKENWIYDNTYNAILVGNVREAQPIVIGWSRRM